MAHEQQRRAVRRALPHEQPQKGFARVVVQRRSRLVGHQRGPAGRAGTCRGHALLLADGKLRHRPRRATPDPRGRARRAAAPASSPREFTRAARAGAKRKASSTFSRTDRYGIRLNIWNTKPTCSPRKRSRCRRRHACSGRSSTRTLPERPAPARRRSDPARCSCRCRWVRAGTRVRRAATQAPDIQQYGRTGPGEFHVLEVDGRCGHAASYS